MRVGNFSLGIVGHPEDSKGYVRLPHDTQYALKLRNHMGRRAQAEVSIDGKSMGTFILEAYDHVELERSADDNGIFTFYRANSEEGRMSEAISIGRNDRGLVQVVFTPEEAKRYVKPVKLSQPKTFGSPWNSKPSFGGITRQFRSSGDSTKGLSRKLSKGAPEYSGSVGYSSEPMDDFCMDWVERDNEVSSNAQFFCNSMGSAPIAASAGVTGLSGVSEQQFRTVSGFPLDKSLAATISLRLVCDEGSPRPLSSVGSGSSNPIPPAI